jgi:hypothetical protein
MEANITNSQLSCAAPVYFHGVIAGDSYRFLNLLKPSDDPMLISTMAVISFLGVSFIPY